MPEAPTSIDKVIKTYIILRTKKDEIENSVKAQVDEIKAKMEKIEAYIQQQSDATGVKSFKTEFGTAFLQTTDFASVADWDAVLNYIKANDAFDLLERRVNKTAVRGYIDSTNAVPDGVSFGTKISVSIRKPAKKGD